ncbi:MAG: DUF4258 domain-containing protein [Deltaproteobacteria bacterium]|nr:DUF4258 domain-containing protein [Deltaproteobacteria bacterium]
MAEFDSTTVTISRHAKRRMQLYGVTADEVKACIAEPQAATVQADGTLVAVRQFPNRFNELPLKVVYLRDGAVAHVLTAFPWKGKSGG